MKCFVLDEAGREKGMISWGFAGKAKCDAGWASKLGLTKFCLAKKIGNQAIFAQVCLQGHEPMLDLVVSTIVFFAATFYLRRYLDEQGMNTGMTRSILVFVLASVVSVGASWAVDFVSGEISGHAPAGAAALPQDGGVSQLLKQLSAGQGANP